MVCLLCDFKILQTVFNQSYNCQTRQYLGKNRLQKPFLILPSLVTTAIGVVEFSREGYKIRKVFAYPKEMFEF